MATIARCCLQHRIAATVPVVISDRPGVAGITTAQELGIETQVVPWKTAAAAEVGAAGIAAAAAAPGLTAPGLTAAGLTAAGLAAAGLAAAGVSPDRAAFELTLSQCIDTHRPDLVVLAGFMRVLSGPFVDRYAGRMLNIHPSLLPKYTGLHTHRRVLEAGDTTHGASVHFVTPELDGGPVILQSQVPVKAGDTEATLAARVQATEHVIYPRVIEWLADGRLEWNNGHPVLDGQLLRNPVVEYFDAD